MNSISSIIKQNFDIIYIFNKNIFIKKKIIINFFYILKIILLKNINLKILPINFIDKNFINIIKFIKRKKLNYNYKYLIFKK
jgi:hypothetical protein